MNHVIIVEIRIWSLYATIHSIIQWDDGSPLATHATLRLRSSVSIDPTNTNCRLNVFFLLSTSFFPLCVNLLRTKSGCSVLNVSCNIFRIHFPCKGIHCPQIHRHSQLRLFARRAHRMSKTYSNLICLFVMKRRIESEGKLSRFRYTELYGGYEHNAHATADQCKLNGYDTSERPNRQRAKKRN